MAWQMVLATSVSSPCFSFNSWRAWPSGEMSASLRSMFFRLTLRRASLLRTISSSALILNWLMALSLIDSFSRMISALASRKSKRLASSFCACSTAFFTSISSTSETTSKEGMINQVRRNRLAKGSLKKISESGESAVRDTVSQPSELLRDGTREGLRVEAIDDTSLGEVVLRHRHLDAVAGGQADETLAHLARNMGENDVLAVVQLDAKHRAGQDRNDLALDFDYVCC